MTMGRKYSERERREFTEANREAWDEAAPVHRRTNHAKLVEGFSRPGFSTLAEHCLVRLREIGIEGRAIAQLCCNNGRELLSLKNLGAGRCVGFDASAAFIEQARELAITSGHTDVEFVTTDIYDLSVSDWGQFDIVLSTIGVIGWMPDLHTFFDIVSGLTREGGHVFIEEIHPVLLMYEEGEGEAPSYLAYSYFKEEPYVETSGLDYYEGKKYGAKPAYSFHHTLSEIMMAAMDAGLTLRHFVELDYNIGELCPDLERAKANPPMGMTMVWERTRVRS